MRPFGSGRAKMGLGLRNVCCAGAIMLFSGCGGKDAVQNPLASRPAATDSTPQDQKPKITSSTLFVDEAAAAGIHFKHDLGDSKHRFYFVESWPAGCAFLDFDNDGFFDVFLVQSGSSERPEMVKNRPLCALYKNQGDGTFTNVISGSGLDKDLGYGMGAAVADYDNDGYADLFITAYNSNHLFRNLGGTGKFEDVTAKAGLARRHDTGFATSAAWGDYDNDGRLDLYVCYYAHWNHALNEECRSKGNVLDYCSPLLYKAVSHRLYRNTPQGFVDVSEKSGIASKIGRGLAVAFLDYDEDGRQDIFVANDNTPNMLWHNRGQGKFEEVAVRAGCAYGEQGNVMAGMAVAIADYDHSGRESVYVTNFSEQPNILFRNLGADLFENVTEVAGLGVASLKFLSFGASFLDYDADGWDDIVVNNGHVQKISAMRSAGIDFEQRKQLLHNVGGGNFQEIKDPTVLGDLMFSAVGRGLAVGDYDNDGRVDIVTMGQNAPTQLLHNRVANGNHWISLKTVGRKSNRDGVGARVELKVGDARRTATVRAGSSYLSTNDSRLYFGLGKQPRVDEMTIQWPSGTRETLKNVAADTFYTLVEGQGIKARHLAGKGK